MATVTRPRSYPNPCFKNPWASLHTVGEGKRGTNGESSINIYTLSCVKPIAGKKSLYNPGRPVWHSGMTLGVGGGRGEYIFYTYKNNV